jgi:hypothetical protein
MSSSSSDSILSNSSTSSSSSSSSSTFMQESSSSSYLEQPKEIYLSLVDDNNSLLIYKISYLSSSILRVRQNYHNTIPFII